MNKSDNTPIAVIVCIIVLGVVVVGCVVGGARVGIKLFLPKAEPMQAPPGPDFQDISEALE